MHRKKERSDGLHGFWCNGEEWDERPPLAPQLKSDSSILMVYNFFSCRNIRSGGATLFLRRIHEE